MKTRLVMTPEEANLFASHRTDLQVIADDNRDNVRYVVKMYGRTVAYSSAYGALVGKSWFANDLTEMRAAIQGTEQALSDVFR